MSSPTIVEYLAEASLLLPSSLLEEAVLPLYFQQGVLHWDSARVPGSWPCAEARSSVSMAVPTSALQRSSVSLSALAMMQSKNLCSWCLTDSLLTLLPGAPRVLWEMVLLNEVLSETRLVTTPLPSKLGYAISSLEGAVKGFKEVSLTGLSADSRSGVEALFEEVAVELKRLRSLLSCDAARDKVFARVRTNLVGKKAASSFVFDESPVLAGISSFVSYEWSSLASQVVEVAAISRSQRGPVLLLVPRYVADWFAVLPNWVCPYQVVSLTCRP